jgi:hypothetical protein
MYRSGLEKFCTMKKGLYAAIFWDIAPCSTWQMKMEGPHSSETSVNIWTTRRYIPEDGNIHNYSSENLKSYKKRFVEKLLRMN